MARPYRDAGELVTRPSDSPSAPEGAVIVVGMAHPAVVEPIPLVLLPGYEYRIRAYVDPKRPDGPIWTMERRAVGRLDEPPDEDDD